MIETLHLIIADRQPADVYMEECYIALHPEIRELDPPVGESRNPAFYSVFTKGMSRHIGMCCLYNFTGQEIELGVRIFIPEYWNKGYGSEIVNALCWLAFGSYPDVVAVLAKTPVLNARAIKCYEKAQFNEIRTQIMDGIEMVMMERRR